jgi:hypothetical protein
MANPVDSQECEKGLDPSYIHSNVPVGTLLLSNRKRYAGLGVLTALAPK